MNNPQVKNKCTHGLLGVKSVCRENAYGPPESTGAARNACEDNTHS